MLVKHKQPADRYTENKSVSYKCTRAQVNTELLTAATLMPIEFFRRYLVPVRQLLWGRWPNIRRAASATDLFMAQYQGRNQYDIHRYIHPQNLTFWSMTFAYTRHQYGGAKMNLLFSSLLFSLLCNTPCDCCARLC